MRDVSAAAAVMVGMLRPPVRGRQGQLAQSTIYLSAFALLLGLSQDTRMNRANPTPLNLPLSS